MIINPNNVENERIKLDLTGAEFSLLNAWKSILSRVKDIESYFIVDLVVPDDVKNDRLTLSVVVSCKDLYVVGFEKSPNVYLKLNDVSYNRYNKICKDINATCLTKEKISENVRQLNKKISSSDINTNILEDDPCYIAFVNIAFIISEAARFEFVRATVKRIYGYLSDVDIDNTFLNRSISDAFYNCRLKYKDLLNDYSKIFEFSKINNTTSIIHSEKVSIESCRNYYSDIKRCEAELPYLQDIGLVAK